MGWDGKKQIYVPFNKILPMVNPDDLVIDGWDINKANLYEAVVRAKVIFVLKKSSMRKLI